MPGYKKSPRKRGLYLLPDVPVHRRVGPHRRDLVIGMVYRVAAESLSSMVNDLVKSSSIISSSNSNSIYRSLPGLMSLLGILIFISSVGPETRWALTFSSETFCTASLNFHFLAGLSGRMLSNMTDIGSIISGCAVSAGFNTWASIWDRLRLSTLVRRDVPLRTLPE